MNRKALTAGTAAHAQCLNGVVATQGELYAAGLDGGDQPFVAIGAAKQPRSA